MPMTTLSLKAALHDVGVPYGEGVEGAGEEAGTAALHFARRQKPPLPQGGALRFAHVLASLGDTF